MTVALSTMWAQQERFRGHMEDFASLAASAGYAAIEPSHSTDRQGLEALISSSSLPLPSLHAPAPLKQDPQGRWNVDLNLAALDEEERIAAVEQTSITIEYARRMGASAVVIHLGACGRGLLDAERQLRSLYQAGERTGETVEHLRAAAARARAALAGQYLPRAQQSLAELADSAARHAIVLGLETRLSYHEIPQSHELAALLDPYPANLVGYWHDVGHAEVQHRLGLIDLNSWVPYLRERTIGVHLHDVAGITDHRAPGLGDVDWTWLASNLPASALRTAEINQHTPEEFLSSGLELLLDHGVVAPD